MVGRPVPRTLDIVVPVLNEEATVDEFIARVDRLGLSGSLVFVDNASTDGTVGRLARHPEVRIVRHDVNEGWGKSIRDGIAASDGDLIVVIDADLEYPPEAIPEILDALRTHPAVYGSRFLGSTAPPMPLVRRIGNRLVSGTYNALFDQRTTDLYTGIKGLRRSVVPLPALTQNGFEHAVELGAVLAVSGVRIHEVPVAYAPRTRGTSKMRHVPETLRFVFLVVGYWFRWVVLGRRPG